MTTTQTYRHGTGNEKCEVFMFKSWQRSRMEKLGWIRLERNISNSAVKILSFLLVCRSGGRGLIVHKLTSFKFLRQTKEIARLVQIFNSTGPITRFNYLNRQKLVIVIHLGMHPPLLGENRANLRHIFYHFIVSHQPSVYTLQHKNLLSPRDIDPPGK